MDNSPEYTSQRFDSLETDSPASIHQNYSCPKISQGKTFFDAVIYYDDKDYNDVKICKEKILKILNDKGIGNVRIAHYNDIEFAPSLVCTDDIMHQCSIFLFYLTNNTKLNFILDELISQTRLGEANEKTFSVIPIHTQQENTRTYKVSTGLRSVRGINWYNCDSDFTKDAICSIFRKAVRVRKENERTHINRTRGGINQSFKQINHFDYFENGSGPISLFPGMESPTACTVEPMQTKRQENFEEPLQNISLERFSYTNTPPTAAHETEKCRERLDFHGAGGNKVDSSLPMLLTNSCYKYKNMDSCEVGNKPCEKHILGECQLSGDMAIKVPCSGEHQESRAEVSKDRYFSITEADVNKTLSQSPFMQMARILKLVNSDHNPTSSQSVIPLGETINSK